jgi:type I restriction enzyme, S subunit
VFNRVNSLTHLGKTSLVGDLDEPLIFESNMMRFRVDERNVFPRFALRLLNSQIFKQQVIASAKRAVAQSSINQGNLKAMVIPLPSLNAQSELLETTEAIICKIDRAKSKINVLGELFRGLLHQLMTAKIRVHDLDLAELESAVAA